MSGRWWWWRSSFARGSGEAGAPRPEPSALSVNVCQASKSGAVPVLIETSLRFYFWPPSPPALDCRDTVTSRRWRKLEGLAHELLYYVCGYCVLSPPSPSPLPSPHSVLKCLLLFTLHEQVLQQPPEILVLLPPKPPKSFPPHQALTAITSHVIKRPHRTLIKVLAETVELFFSGRPTTTTLALLGHLTFGPCKPRCPRHNSHTRRVGLLSCDLTGHDLNVQRL